MLDTKDEKDIALLADAPRLTDYLCAECESHFTALRSHLSQLQITYDVDARLVRGFDYYTKTAFEIVSPDVGAQSSLCGGGRYDGLVQELGGPATPGIGFGMGVERALIALQALNKTAPEDRRPSAFLVTLGDSAREARLQLLTSLRQSHVAADADYSGKSMKAQMRAANKSQAKYAVIVGDDEIAKGTAQLKNLATSEQREVAQSRLAEALLEMAGQ